MVDHIFRPPPSAREPLRPALPANAAAIGAAVAGVVELVFLALLFVPTYGSGTMTFTWFAFACFLVSAVVAASIGHQTSGPEGEASANRNTSDHE